MHVPAWVHWATFVLVVLLFLMMLFGAPEFRID